MTAEHREYNISGVANPETWSSAALILQQLGFQVDRADEPQEISITTPSEPVVLLNRADFYALSSDVPSGKAIATRSWKCLTRLHTAIQYPHDSGARQVSDYNHVGLQFRQPPSFDPRVKWYDYDNALGDLEKPSLQAFVAAVEQKHAKDPYRNRLDTLMGRSQGPKTLDFLKRVLADNDIGRLAE